MITGERLFMMGVAGILVIAATAGCSTCGWVCADRIGSANSAGISHGDGLLVPSGPGPGDSRNAPSGLGHGDGRDAPSSFSLGDGHIVFSVSGPSAHGGSSGTSASPTVAGPATPPSLAEVGGLPRVDQVGHAQPTAGEWSGRTREHNRRAR